MLLEAAIGEMSSRECLIVIHDVAVDQFAADHAHNGDCVCSQFLLIDQTELSSAFIDVDALDSTAHLACASNEWMEP